jgi:sensor c-di-GMP phosphodiesterase-like protein
MHAAKDQGKQRSVTFEPTMHSLVLERLDLAADLEHDIALGKLSLVYQPIVSLDSGQITSVEALLRWNHTTRGQLGPNMFIPLAEQARQLGGSTTSPACRLQ